MLTGFPEPVCIFSDLEAEGRLDCQFPGRVPEGTAVPSVRDGAGQDTNGEHGKLHLPRVPTVVILAPRDRRHRDLGLGRPRGRPYNLARLEEVLHLAHGGLAGSAAVAGGR